MGQSNRIGQRTNGQENGQREKQKGKKQTKKKRRADFNMQLVSSTLGYKHDLITFARHRASILDRECAARWFHELFLCAMHSTRCGGASALTARSWCTFTLSRVCVLVLRDVAAVAVVRRRRRLS